MIVGLLGNYLAVSSARWIVPLVATTRRIRLPMMPIGDTSAASFVDADRRHEYPVGILIRPCGTRLIPDQPY